jgi:hypothetical protein
MAVSKIHFSLTRYEMQFKGKAWGDPFPVEKAASHVEVFQGLAIAGVDDVDARCWVLSS